MMRATETTWVGRPPRILQLANQPGPLALFQLPVCRALHQSGAQVELACMRVGALAERLEQESEFPVHWLPAESWANPLGLWRTYRRLQGLLNEGHYDLLIVHTPVISWPARLAARGRVRAVLYMAHGLPFAPHQNPLVRAVLRFIERRLARFTDGLIVMNRADADFARGHRLTRRPNMVFEVPGVGVDVAEWAAPPPAEEMAELERVVGLTPGRPLVLYLGRMIATKRPGDMLELARRLGPVADIVLAGEGSLMPSLRRQAEQIGPHVHVLGFSSRARQLLHRSAVVVLPSLSREGLPRVLLEAAAAGKPAVAYDIRGSQDAIENGVSGYLVKPGDAEGLADAVGRLLEDESLRQRLGQSARQRVQEQFSLEAAVDAQMAAIGKVMLLANRL